MLLVHTKTEMFREAIVEVTVIRESGDVDSFERSATKSILQHKFLYVHNFAKWKNLAISTLTSKIFDVYPIER